MKKGFTLLELVIVIIIIGVLASLALPKFFRLIEFSRSAEALSAMASIRASVERCYLMRNSWGSCNGGYKLNTPPGDWSLDISYPGDSPNAHFNYSVFTTVGGVGYYIGAVRNTLDGGASGDTDGIGMWVTYFGPKKGILKCARGAFKPIGERSDNLCPGFPGGGLP